MNMETAAGLESIIHEITPLSDKDCFYIADRHKTEFTYPIHNHAEFEPRKKNSLLNIKKD
jgi:hypothetical protein